MANAKFNWAINSKFNIAFNLFFKSSKDEVNYTYSNPKGKKAN